MEVIYIGKRSKVLGRIYKSLPKGELYSLDEAMNKKNQFYNKIVILFSLPYKNKVNEYLIFVKNLKCKLFINISSICALNNNYKSKVGRSYQINKNKTHLITQYKKNSINIVCGSFVENQYDVHDPFMGVHFATEYGQLIDKLSFLLNNSKKIKITQKNIFCFKIYGNNTKVAFLIKFLREISNFVHPKVTLALDYFLKLIKVKNRFYTNESNSYCSKSLQLGNFKKNLFKLLPSEILVNNDDFKLSSQNKFIILKNNLLRKKYIKIKNFYFDSDSNLFIINGLDLKINKEIYLFSNRIIINNQNKNYDLLIKNLLFKDKSKCIINNENLNLLSINYKSKKLIVYQ